MRLVAACLVALMISGCLGTDRSAWEKELRNGALPGLVMKVQVSRDGDQYEMKADVRNEGSRIYQSNEMCDRGWSHEIRQPDGTRVWPGSAASCLGMSLKDFGPGAASGFEGKWNETKEADGKYEPAAKGDHVWLVSMRVWDAGAARTIETEVDIQVK